MNREGKLAGVVTFVLLLLIAVFWFNVTDKGSEARSADGMPSARQSTASLQKLGLVEMVDRAGKIFRGTVIDFEPGTISAGGGTLPTVKYLLRVEHGFKGTFAEKDGMRYAEITMLGNVKDGVQRGNFRKFATLPDPPKLVVGGDYLLLLTPESEIGLTTTVGLGQGSFRIYQQDKQEWAKNEFDNAGLFRGPVKYSQLVAAIQKRGGKNR